MPCSFLKHQNNPDATHPLTVVAFKKCWGVTFASTTAQFIEPVSERGCTGNGASQLWGARPSPVRYGTVRFRRAASSCLLVLELSAVDQGLGTIVYAAAQVWYHEERAVIMRAVLFVTRQTCSACYNAQ
jgi:hypothetical protein